MPPRSPKGPGSSSPRGGKPAGPARPAAKGGASARGGRIAGNAAGQQDSWGAAGGWGQGGPPARIARAAAKARASKVGPARGAWTEGGDRPDRAPRGGPGWGDDAPRGARGASAKAGPGRPSAPSRGPRPDGPSRGPRPDGPARGGRSAGPGGARVDGRPTRPARPRANEDEGEEIGQRDLIVGRHAVTAALEGEGGINKVWAMENLRPPTLLPTLRELAKAKGAIVQVLSRDAMDSLTGGATHQGVACALSAVPFVDLDELIVKAVAQEHPALVVLDGLEDPHNVGAILRTAEAFGFAGAAIPNRRAVGLTPTVAKAAAGALARLPVARVANVAQALKKLSEEGFWLIGADGEGEVDLWDADLTKPLVLVIGSEGRGLGRLVGERCDQRLRIPMAEGPESLNASVAAGVIMAEAARQRRMASLEAQAVDEADEADELDEGQDEGAE